MKRAIAILGGLTASVLLTSLAFAHDQPTLRVDPSIAPAGGSITCVGIDMALDTRWTITLERAGRAITLRDSVVATGDEEGGFTIGLTVPADTAPGSYTVRATSTDGKSATADLTVTDKTTMANASAATMRMASGEEHVLDRGKPAEEVVTLWALAAAAGAVGTFLVLSKDGA